MNLILRKGIPQDAKAIADHQIAMALETEAIRLDPERIALGVAEVFNDSSKGFYIVAEVDEKLVGNLLITKEWSDWTNRWVWWVQSVYVQPGFREKGIYRGLYEKAREFGKMENVRVIRLYVDQHNAKAMAVYERLGMMPSHYRLYEEVIET